VTFEDGMAQFIALHGRHVSRRHLVIRWTGEHFEFQDLKSTNGTFGLLDKVAFESDTWHRLQPGDRIFLGGQASDERRLSPAVCLSPPQRDHQATPMRISLDAADKTWDLVSPAHGLTWRVCQLPFLIGRDPACDAVVPTQHRMVSRKHLVIVSIDLEGQSWEVKDLSTQKLTHFLGPVQSLPGGIYRLQLDSQVILGQTASASGLNLCLLRNGGKV
jgi:predicted component of type VI protein secretion system